MGQQSGTSAQGAMGGGAGGGDNVLSQMMQFYSAGTPPVAGALEKNILKGGVLDMPSFNELFGSYRQIADTEAKRQAAGINDAFGSQGGRYSSALLNAQSNLRERQTNNLANAASQYQLGLRQQQAGEVGSLAGLQAAIGENATSRMFQDFLRRTSPPPLLGQSSDFFGSFGQPATVFA